MIRTAEMIDYRPVKKLIRQGEEEGSLAHRKKKDIKKAIRKGRTVVSEIDGQVVGTASVEVYSRRLAEIRSVFVASEHRGQGIGTDLVEGLLIGPVERIPSSTVFAISKEPKIFENLGFATQIDQRRIQLRNL